MSVKLVTYDISDDDKRDECREAIKEYDYIEVGKSDYLINTDETCQEIKNSLKKYLDSDDEDDELFVCAVTEDEWSSYLIGSEKREWIKDNI